MNQKNKFLITISFISFFAFPFLVNASDIVINEIMYNLPGTDSKHEWIEILNNSSSEINLIDWKFNDGSNHTLNEPPQNGGQGSLIIPAGEYAILTGNAIMFLADHSGFSGTVIDTVMSLKNTTSVLKILDPTGNEIDSITYENSWGADGNGKTLEKINVQEANTQDNWQESIADGGTPGAENSSETTEEILNESQSESFKSATDYPPIADAGPDVITLAGKEIFFDGNLSSDPDWDELTFFWNFGDGATSTQKEILHSYQFPGQYVVSLSVQDNKFSAIDIALINVYSSSILISEFMPGQWIEIYNQSEYIGNLSNWKLNDFTFPENTLIAPWQFLILKQENDFNQVNLFCPDGSLISQISFSEKKENSSIALHNQEYFWTKTPTPSQTNIINSSINSISNLISNENQVKIPELNQKVNLINQEISLIKEETEEVKIEEEDIFKNQAAGISDKVSLKPKLILILSIIISSSLFLSWIIILIKKRVKTH